MEGPAVVLAALVGLPAGHLAAAVAERWDSDLPTFGADPPCASCGAPRTGLARAPLVGAIGPAAACRGCGAPRGRTYLAAEIVTAAAVALVAARLPTVASAVAYGALAAGLVCLSIIDLEHQRLPQVVLRPMTICGAALLVVASVADGRTEAIERALLGGSFFFGFLFLANLVYPRGMGMGDVKLAFPLGLHLGWLAPDLLVAFQLTLYGMFLGMLGGSVAGMAVLALRRKSQPYPFGPFLAAGAYAAAMWNTNLLA